MPRNRTLEKLETFITIMHEIRRELAPDYYILSGEDEIFLAEYRARQSTPQE